jgi:hypothetical protein
VAFGGSSVTSISLLGVDVFSEQLSQLLLPFDAPGKRFGENAL